MPDFLLCAAHPALHSLPFVGLVDGRLQWGGKRKVCFYKHEPQADIYRLAGWARIISKAFQHPLGNCGYSLWVSSNVQIR